MTIKNMLLSIGRISIYSKKNIHIIVLFFSCLFNALFITNKIHIHEDDKMSILTGISLLSSLFLLAVEHIDFHKINMLFTGYIKISKNKQIK